MCKLKLIMFSFFLLTAELKTQTWRPLGAKWHYRINNTNAPFYDGVLELNYSSTVSVNSIICKEIVGAFHGKQTQHSHLLQ